MTKVAIIGLGLIGGSLGLALKRGGPWEVVGYSRRPETAQEAQRQGAIDRAELSLGRAVVGADLVVVATPIGAMPQVFQEMAPHLPPSAVVTDIASTKGQVMAWAQAHLPPEVSFVGGHPMAGKESWGLEASEPTLFQGAIYCLIPTPGAPPQATRRVVDMVEAIGARPLFLSAEEHDHQVAGISHLPRLLATALVVATSQDKGWEGMSRLAASGYRDTTRLASDSPVMARDFCLTNQRAILAWLDRFMVELGNFRLWMEQQEGEALGAAFVRAREARQGWLAGKKASA